MASLVYTATDEYGNDITVRLPDWTGQPLLATTATPPDGTLVADGSEVSREAYAELFAKIGTTYGEGDGVNTFNLPDWRDEFPRFSGSGRAVGTKQSDAIRDIQGSFSNFAYQNQISPDGVYVRTSGAFYINLDVPDAVTGPTMETQQDIKPTGDVVLFAANKVVPTADENRPRNVAFLPCIIYV